MANDNHRPSKEVEQLTLVARESLRHILEGWVYNVNVGKAMDAYRRQLFRELGITKPNHQYKEIMGRYLRANEFHRINKTTRTFLQKCIDNLAAIEQWRATLTEEERDAWNGPRAVWDHWPDKPENLRQVKPKPADIIWIAIRDNGEEDYLVFEKQGDAENYRGSYEVTRGLGSCVVRPEPASNFDFPGCILSDDGVWERDGETPPKRVASARLPKNYSQKISNPRPKAENDPIVAVLSQLYPKIYKGASDPAANAIRRDARERLEAEQRAKLAAAVAAAAAAAAQQPDSPPTTARTEIERIVKLETEIKKLEAMMKSAIPIECLEIALAVDPWAFADAFGDDEGQKVIAPLPQKLRALANAFENHDGKSKPELGDVRICAYRLVFDTLNGFATTRLVDLDDPTASEYRVEEWAETEGDGGDCIEWCHVSRFDTKAEAIKAATEITQQQRATEKAAAQAAD
jgi:hypothetical protein